MSKKPVVYLGLSGGVDSAVAAVLLLREGYDVKGVFLKIWSDSMEESGVCPWVQDRLDAIAVAAKVGIPLITLDFEKQYRDQVFRYFVQEYKAGRTPNPDILCNEIIKFGTFLDYALEHGADYIATGHHARRMPETGKEETVYSLLSGVDEKKDQSYFLAKLNQHQLRHTLFPIGHLTKDQVRQIAKEEGLDVVAEKRSTRGICFIGKVDLKEFLSKYTIAKPGDVIDLAGKKVGKHKGVSFYTIGQRKGLEIPAQTNESKPYYVVEKRAETNQLVVAQDSDAALRADELYCRDLHWIDGKIRKLPLDCEARIRYHQPLQEATLSFGSKDQRDPSIAYVKFKEVQRSITPGQFVVFYQGEEVLGCAVID